MLYHKNYFKQPHLSFSYIELDSHVYQAQEQKIPQNDHFEPETKQTNFSAIKGRLKPITTSKVASNKAENFIPLESSKV